ncbi:putative deoxyuridine 5'-triphosphate nucleotidohydrolase [Sphaerulina musiva]
MILPGKTAISRGIILNLTNPTLQIQPCGIDLSLRKIFSWTSAGTVDFSNQFRAGSRKEQLEFTGTRTSSSSPKTKSIHLSAGNYMVEFHEEVNMPLDIMGQIFVRSSLWRMGALLSAGVMDSGYQGAVGGLLQVLNPHGIVLHEHARLAQMVFHVMAEKVEGGGYSGVYQGAKGL